MTQFSELTVGELITQGYAVAIFHMPASRLVRQFEITRPRRRAFVQAPREGSDRQMAWDKIRRAGHPLHISEIAPGDKKKQASLRGSMGKAEKRGRFFKNVGGDTWDIIRYVEQ